MRASSMDFETARLLGVLRYRLAHRKHLQPHADADRVQDCRLPDRCDGGAAVRFARHQPVALEHPQRIANRHNAEAELVGQLSQQQPLAGAVLAVENAAAELMVGELALCEMGEGGLGRHR